MNRRRLWIAAVIVAIPALAIGWWLGSPLFIDDRIDEGFPMSAGAEIPAGMTQEEVEEEMADAAAEVSELTEDMPVSDEQPMVLVSGQFTGADDFHQGSGLATVYELESGERVLRLEDFTVTNGPDLHVILVPHPTPMGGSDVEGYLDLGSLKGNIGSQNYTIPNDVDLSEYGSVVIYCVPFHVIFATATLG